MSKKPVEEKQRRFIEEFLKDRNATKAAERAGYSKKTARNQGSRLLAKDDIWSAIQKKLEAQLQRVSVDADAVLLELARIAQCDISKAFNEDGSLKPLHDIPVDVRRAIAGVETVEVLGSGGDDGEEGEGKRALVQTKKLKFWNKNEALQTLARHFKLLTDRVEIHDSRKLAERLRKARERRRS